MQSLLPIIFAAIAAVGNTLFALGQKESTGMKNGLVFVVLSACVAVFVTLLFAPIAGAFNVGEAIRSDWKSIILSGVGLFLTYFGFNLLYSRYGVSCYVLYAVLSIVTTTILVGMIWLRKPVTVYHKVAIIMAVAAVIFFSIGQSKA